MFVTGCASPPVPFRNVMRNSVKIRYLMVKNQKFYSVYAILPFKSFLKTRKFSTSKLIDLKYIRLYNFCLQQKFLVLHHAKFF